MACFGLYHSEFCGDTYLVLLDLHTSGSWFCFYLRHFQLLPPTYISITSTLPFTSKCNSLPDSLPCPYSLINFSFNHPFNVYLSLHLSALYLDNDHTPIMYISLIIWLPVSLLFPFIAISWSCNSIKKKKNLLLHLHGINSCASEALRRNLRYFTS